MGALGAPPPPPPLGCLTATSRGRYLVPTAQCAPWPQRPTQQTPAGPSRPSSWRLSRRLSQIWLTALAEPSQPHASARCQFLHVPPPHFLLSPTSVPFVALCKSSNHRTAPHCTALHCVYRECHGQRCLVSRLRPFPYCVLSPNQSPRRSQVVPRPPLQPARQIGEGTTRAHGPAN